MTTAVYSAAYSVERRSSGAASTFAGSDFTGSILALSTRGVSTREATSAWDSPTEPVASA